MLSKKKLKQLYCLVCFVSFSAVCCRLLFLFPPHHHTITFPFVLWLSLFMSKTGNNNAWNVSAQFFCNGVIDGGGGNGVLMSADNDNVIFISFCLMPSFVSRPGAKDQGSMGSFHSVWCYSNRVHNKLVGIY